MIRFVVHNTKPIEAYLAWHGRAARDFIRPITYGELFARPQPDAAPHCFVDIELLSAEERARAGGYRAWLVERGWRVCNDPERTPNRMELQHRLRAAGINDFALHPWPVASDAVRFPVFLRHASDHAGPRSELLHTADELEHAARQLLEGGSPADDLVVVEFCDTADSTGSYRKYGAFVLDGTIVPRHLLISRSWVTKDSDRWDESALVEERTYVSTNPHVDRLAAVFASVGIDYGRVDYALRGDALQVWEINTNPTITYPPPDLVRASIRRRRALAVHRNGARERPGLRRSATRATRSITDRLPPLVALERARWERRPRAAIQAALADRLLPLWEQIATSRPV